MNDQERKQWEGRLSAAAGAFPYPPTPNIAVGVRRRLNEERGRRAARRRRLAWAAAAAALILVGLMAVPQVRAGVLEFLRLGAIRILIGEPSPTAPAFTPAAPTGTPMLSVLDLAGETTLENAREEAGFPIRLPAYPPDLGAPDRVYVQRLGGQVVVLVWLDPEQPGQPTLSLFVLGPGTFGDKVQPQVIQETQVNGRPALWVEGPYILELGNGRNDIVRVVEGYTLIWQEGFITYRLETDLPLEEAVRIAESLR